MAQMTRIEQLINNIYDFIEDCKPNPLAPSKIIVAKDQLLDLVDELKRRMPDEIKRYQKIIANRDTIIADAEEKARVIESEAREQASQLVNETEIMQAAYKQANELIQNATAEAERIRVESEEARETIRTGVLSYAEDILSKVQTMMDQSYRQTKENSERLVSCLEQHLRSIESDRHELLAELNSEPSDDDFDGDDFDNIPDDAFLNNVDQ